MGYTMQLPTNDRYVLGERELATRLTVLVAGRVAEALEFGKPRPVQWMTWPALQIWRDGW